MKTIYVVTTSRRPLSERARGLVCVAIAWLLLAGAVLGHTLILLVSAIDALLAATFGTRRIGYISGRLCDAVRETWKESHD
ncbi:hypothetical protein [Streptosporangium sp. NPDC049078]|uniref:hypothetical protein n=1 Tax=Streptosporangium sp. NPDC049078 TaxID=3155767 RepID=UPI00344AC35E